MLIDMKDSFRSVCLKIRSLKYKGLIDFRSGRERAREEMLNMKDDPDESLKTKGRKSLKCPYPEKLMIIQDLYVIPEMLIKTNELAAGEAGAKPQIFVI
jgi:hypothetical protein